jgi:hypothetical protein
MALLKHHNMHRLLSSLPLSQLSFLVMFHFLGTEYGLQNMAISFGLLVLQLFDLEFFQGDRGYVE